MSVPVQMIHVHYQGKYLKLLDSDDQTTLYSIRVGRVSPQMEMVRIAKTPQLGQLEAMVDSEPPVHKGPDSTMNGHTNSSSTCTAAFPILALGVTMRVRGKEVRLERSSALTRTYSFSSAGAETRLTWEADGALSGDFRLVDLSRHCVLARFRNKLFSNAEVGAFEVIGNVSELLREEILISGLSVLVMVQSINLATMVLFGVSS
ncbi:hypothetical protein F4677DRAFT_408474 [Hypoxylon crocopeplum]|nr:hypothetical protein F4677DRAFT_408474 [Hypoxylon crocopeplum]